MTELTPEFLERQAKRLEELNKAMQECAHENAIERVDAIGRTHRTCKCGLYEVKGAAE